jgi:competence protein ComEC
MPLFWLSLAFLGGILLGELLDWPLRTWLALLGLACGLTLMNQAAKRRLGNFYSRLPIPPNISIPYSLLLIALLFGAARLQSAQPTINSDFIAWYNDHRVEYVVQGVLVEPPDVRDQYTNLKVRAEELHAVGELNFIPVDGLLLARVPHWGSWRYGDKVRLEGDLVTPPEREGFTYREYLAHQGIYSLMPGAQARTLLHDQGNPIRGVIYRKRAEALDMVYQLFPDPEASLLAGILLGVETGIPQHVQGAFNDTGTSHIIAISGFNITILSGFFVFVFVRILGKRRRFYAALVTAVLIGLYTVFVGAEAAVVRAAIMGGLALAAALLGRRQDGLNTLAFVAALMALFDPHVLWDVGFQLSFMATLGLLLYGEPLTKGYIRLASPRLSMDTARRTARPVTEYILITFAAILTTLPVVVYHFQRLSLVSLVANPAILPVQPPVMILSGTAVILGMLYQPAGRAAALLAWPFAAYTIRAVELFAKIPGGVFVLGEVTLFLVLLFYGVLFSWTSLGRQIKDWVGQKLDLENVNYLLYASITAVVLGVLAGVVWRAALAAPDGKLHITLLDVGSGDGILVQTPTGRNLLIDGGPSPSKLSDALGRRLPLAARRLDYLVVAAAGEGQIGALPRTVERFPPDQVLWAGTNAGTFSARELRRTLARNQIPNISAESGQSLELGAGARLEVLEVSSRGAVLQLRWGRFSALLPVGLDFETMEGLLTNKELTPVSVLLLAESGYAPLNPAEWIAHCNPQLILLSVAADDYDGLPDRVTLQAVEGYPLKRTDLNGWVRVSTNGEQMWVQVEKEASPIKLESEVLE